MTDKQVESLCQAVVLLCQAAVICTAMLCAALLFRGCCYGV